MARIVINVDTHKTEAGFDLLFNKRASGYEFTTLHFLYNIRMGPITWKLTLYLAGEVCQRKTL